MNQICPKCQTSIDPLERLEKDGAKTWLIRYCPNDRCKYNLDIESVNIKLWNAKESYFEDYTK
jgi:hypothetical protein